MNIKIKLKNESGFQQFENPDDAVLWFVQKLIEKKAGVDALLEDYLLYGDLQVNGKKAGFHHVNNFFEPCLATAITVVEDSVKEEDVEGLLSDLKKINKVVFGFDPFTKWAEDIINSKPIDPERLRKKEQDFMEKLFGSIFGGLNFEEHNKNEKFQIEPEKLDSWLEKVWLES